MRILLIGGSGMLGFDLDRILRRGAHEVLCPPHSELDVSIKDSVLRALDESKPHAVINTAALHPVEACERDPERAFAINSLAPRILAQACKERGSVLVHYSSDFVFDGKSASPYTEDDPVSPLNMYGVSKAAGEQLIRSTHPEHIIIRSASMFGVAGNRAKGCNFVELMLRKAAAGDSIRVVSDVRMSPASTRELAEQTALLLEQRMFGTFHICNHGECSWFEFAQRIFDLAGIKADVQPIPHDLAGWGGPRPLYSALRNARLQELGSDRMKSVDEALRNYLLERKSVGNLTSQGEYKGPRPTASG